MSLSPIEIMIDRMFAKQKEEQQAFTQWMQLCENGFAAVLCGEETEEGYRLAMASYLPKLALFCEEIDADPTFITSATTHLDEVLERFDQ